jgi:periplasmic protein CpxP/Spy
MMKRNLRNILLATLLAAVTPMLSAPVQAQNMPMMPFAHAEKLAAKLKLTPEQKTQWDTMVQKTKTQHEAMKKAHHEMHEAMKAELAKPEPDLAALATKADAMHDQLRAAHRELRDGWLKLYATMNAEQKGVVKQAILRHMRKMHHMHEGMVHHHHEHDGDHGAAKPADGQTPKSN